MSVREKSSVYNQPSVYNQGVNRTSPSTPENIENKGKLFKNFFPIKLFSHSLFDSDFILLGSAFPYSDPIILNGNFEFTSTDVVEIQFRASKPNIEGNHNTLFGVVSGDYSKNISMDFANLNAGVTSVFLGIPEPTNNNSWSHHFALRNLVISPNKFYTINATLNKVGQNIATLSIEDDVGLKSDSITFDELNGSGELQLQGLVRMSANHFNGSIDMSNCYIRKNGITLWGVVE